MANDIKTKKIEIGNEECVATYVTDEINDVKILDDSFIKFAYDGEDANLNGNIKGLISFIQILNKLLKRKYNFVRLADTQAGDFFTYDADYFFDYSSNYLSLNKEVNKNNYIKCKDSVGWADKKELIIDISKDKLKELRNDIIKLIKDSKKDKFEFQLSDSKLFIINKLYCEAIRK